MILLWLFPTERWEKSLLSSQRILCLLLFLTVVTLKVNSRYQEGVTMTRFSDDRDKLMQDQWPGY